MDWNDIRQHVATIFGNIHDNETADEFAGDAVRILVEDGEDMSDPQDVYFANRYAIEYHEYHS